MHLPEPGEQGIHVALVQDAHRFNLFVVCGVAHNVAARTGESAFVGVGHDTGPERGGSTGINRFGFIDRANSTMSFGFRQERGEPDSPAASLRPLAMPGPRAPRPFGDPRLRAVGVVSVTAD
jgi:hypothetical protein